MAVNLARDDAEEEKLLALGLVVDHAALMEHDLGRAFTLLLGSEFAVPVAAGQTADWLMQNCEILARTRQGIPEHFRAAITDALAECRTASHRRNTLVHAIKTNSEHDGRLETILTKRGGRQYVQAWTPASIRSVADELLDSSTHLLFTVEQALEAEAVTHRERTQDGDHGQA